MTSGLRFARDVYSAAVYPAGPLPMMMTFSMLAHTLLCIVPLGGRYTGAVRVPARSSFQRATVRRS